jgi:hypothetical protein
VQIGIARVRRIQAREGALDADELGAIRVAVLVEPVSVDQTRKAS